jgi:hypothetical protein
MWHLYGTGWYDVKFTAITTVSSEDDETPEITAQCAGTH